MFRYAQVLERLGLYDEAMDTAMRYLTLAGREGKFYREALQLINATAAGQAAALETADAAKGLRQRRRPRRPPKLQRGRRGYATEIHAGKPE